MKFCDLTFRSPEENLACDEALLEACEAGESEELLRVWEPAQYFVVLGYANRAETEVDLPFCRRNTIPVLRRCTGGGTVLQGPGCLNYSLLLKIEENGPLGTITSANRFIMERNRDALDSKFQVPSSKFQIVGHTDLALDARPSTLDPVRKFSGN